MFSAFTRFVIFTFAAFSSVVSFAQSEAIGFKTIPLGASVEDYRAAFPDHDCITATTCLFDRRKCARSGADGAAFIACTKRNTWAGITPETIFATFKDGKLERVSIAFSSSSFQMIRDAAKERYGQPLQELSEDVQTRAGAQLQNITARWEQGESVMLIRKYGSTIDKGSALIQTRTSFLEALERVKNQPKAGAKDM